MEYDFFLADSTRKFQHKKKISCTKHKKKKDIKLEALSYGFLSCYTSILGGAGRHKKGDFHSPHTPPPPANFSQILAN